MINWSDFHFLRPLWLLALPIIMFAWYFVSARHHKKTSWDRVIEPHLLPHLFRERAPRRQSRFSFLWPCAFLFLAIIALAGPTLKKLPNETAFAKAPLVICLEVSPHMLARDVNPSRFKRALFKLEDLLARHKGAEVALIAFAGDAHLVVPLSNDYNTIMTMAKILSPDVMPIKGVNLTSALNLAKDVTKKAPRAHVVVMTSSNFDDQNASLANLSMPVLVWAFATVAGGPLELADGRFDQRRGGEIAISKLREENLAKLRALPNVTTLTFSADQRDVDTVIAAVSNDTPVKSVREDIYDQWYDLGPYVLAAAVIVLMAAIMFGQAQFIFLSAMLLLPSGESKASFADWFLRRDQQAERALEDNKPEQAAQLFDDAFHKGSAYFRAKKFDEAIKHLSTVNNSDGQYNLGNAYAHKRQFQEAIDAYTRALEMNPANEDAKANKELLEKYQKQEQEKQKQDKQESDQKEKSDNEDKQDKSENKGKENSEGQQDKDKPAKENNEEKKPTESEKKNELDKKKNEESKGQKPEEKPGETKKPGEQLKDKLDDEKLDPETRYHFQRLEQNNSLFLKRKFLFESQKRQVQP